MREEAALRHANDPLVDYKALVHRSYHRCAATNAPDYCRLEGPRVPMSRNCASDTASALKTNPREFSSTGKPKLAACRRLPSGNTDDIRNSSFGSSPKDPEGRLCSRLGN